MQLRRIDDGRGLRGHEHDQRRRLSRRRIRKAAGVQVIGRALTTNSGAGTYLIFASLEPPSSGSASAVPWFTQPSASGTFRS